MVVLSKTNFPLYRVLISHRNGIAKFPGKVRRADSIVLNSNDMPLTGLAAAARVRRRFTALSALHQIQYRPLQLQLQRVLLISCYSLFGYFDRALHLRMRSAVIRVGPGFRKLEAI
jgi:hypothetical protein